jgi:hypothetical protein
MRHGADTHPTRPATSYLPCHWKDGRWIGCAAKAARPKENCGLELRHLQQRENGFVAVVRPTQIGGRENSSQRFCSAPTQAAVGHSF